VSYKFYYQRIHLFFEHQSSALLLSSYQGKLKGNMVNGRQAIFSGEELNQFSSALVDLSNEIKDTTLRISH